MSHGNDKKNDQDHHLYAINDRQRDGLYKYGISGRSLRKDGSSPRANEQISLFNRVVGWSRFFAEILLVGIKGREKAENTERDFINKHKDKHGENPPGNL